jgi:hypothetical protein
MHMPYLREDDEFNLDSTIKSHRIIKIVSERERGRVAMPDPSKLLREKSCDCVALTYATKSLRIPYGVSAR